MSPRLCAISAILYIYISAQYAGLNAAKEFAGFLLNYNYLEILYQFYRPVFNSFQNPQADVVVSASIRNELSIPLILSCILIIFNHANFSISKAGKILDFVLILLLSIIILSMFARSSLMILVFAVGSYFYSYFSRKGNRAASILITTIGGLVSGIIIADYVQNSVTLADRIISDTASYSGRLEQFELALRSLAENPILGVGYFTTLDGFTIHNFLLSNFAYGGLVPFLLSIYIIIQIVIIYHELINHKTLWLLSPIPFIILLKMMIAGNSGYPDISSLIGFVLACRLIEISQINQLRVKNTL